MAKFVPWQVKFPCSGSPKQTIIFKSISSVRLSQKNFPFPGKSGTKRMLSDSHGGLPEWLFRNSPFRSVFQKRSISQDGSAQQEMIFSLVIQCNGKNQSRNKKKKLDTIGGFSFHQKARCLMRDRKKQGIPILYRRFSV